jgi:hypothetical protein
MFNVPFGGGYVEIDINSDLSRYVPKNDDFETSDQFVYTFIRDFPEVISNFKKNHPENVLLL